MGAESRRHADRARQFMPFASLRGYYDFIREQEREKEPRRELSEDGAQEQSSGGYPQRGGSVTAELYALPPLRRQERQRLVPVRRKRGAVGLIDTKHRLTSTASFYQRKNADATWNFFPTCASKIIHRRRRSRPEKRGIL